MQQQPRPNGHSSALPTPRKTRPERRYRLTVWKHLEGQKRKGEDTLTLAQRIRLNQERGRAANCEQRRLIFELSCDKETIPAKLISDVALVYKILQEKLVVETNWQRSTITTMFATDPSHPWSWSVMFDSTITKQF